MAAARPGAEALVRDLGAELFVLGAAALDAVRTGGAFASLVAGGAPYPLRGIRVVPV